MKPPASLQDLLNTDVDAIGRWVATGWSWWIGELTEMVPGALRRDAGRRNILVAEMPSETAPIRLWRGDALLEVLGDSGGNGRAADLMLPAGAVLSLDLELPRMSPGDLRRLLELNMDRYTPFRADQVHFDVALLGRTGDGARQRVRLGLLERLRGGTLLDRARASGLDIQRIGVAAGDDGRLLQFDFRPSMQTGRGGNGSRRRTVWLWGACGALLAANVLAAVLIDMSDVAGLERQVEAQRPLAAAALRVRRTVDAEQARRMALLTRRSVHEPLRILDAVTRAVAPGAWVQRMEWNGRSVRLVGFKPPALDLLSALNGRALGEARSLASDMPTLTPAGQAPFDVLARSTAQAPR